MLNLPDPSHEAVTAPRNCLDKPLPIPILAQRLPQNRDVVRQVDLFNDGVRPDNFKQLIFFQEMTVMFDQDVEQIEGFWLKRDGLSVAHQHSLGDVQTECAEVVDVIWLVAHHLSPLSRCNGTSPKIP